MTTKTRHVLSPHGLGPMCCSHGEYALIVDTSVFDLDPLTTDEKRVTCSYCLEVLEEDQEWFTLVGYPKYEISKFGRVRNKKTKYVLMPQLDKYNTPNIYLYLETNKRTRRSLLRLMFDTFSCEFRECYVSTDKPAKI